MVLCISSNLVKVIKNMYKDSAVLFKTGVEMREIPYTVGVKQGDNMAPVLFIYLMNAFAKTMSIKWTFKKLDYTWFPESNNRNKRGGHLTGQSSHATVRAQFIQPHPMIESTIKSFFKIQTPRNQYQGACTPSQHDLKTCSTL
eukprot:scaffold60711_cov65-Attheya_sp.AAC.8